MAIRKIPRARSSVSTLKMKYDELLRRSERQSERARNMAVRARQMSDVAVEMRKGPRQIILP